MIRIYRHFFPAITLRFMIVELCLLFVLTDFTTRLSLRSSIEDGSGFGLINATTLSFLLVIATALSGLAAGLYRQNTGSNRGWIVTAAAATGLSLCLGIAVVAGLDAFSPRQISLGQREIALTLICPICFVITRRVAITAARLGLFTRRLLLIGNGLKAAEIAAFADKSGKAIQIVKWLRLDDSGMLSTPVPPDAPSATQLRAEGIGEVVVADDESPGLPMELLLQWKLSGIAVIDCPTFWEREAGQITLDTLTPTWFVFGDGCRRGPLGGTIKRSLDIVVSLALLILTAPLWCTFALLIRAETPGPILYRQQRTGRYGKPFMLLKFRSMKVDAETTVPLWAIRDDPRVTRVGRFMRSTRIDELPQLVNVILGHMSLIGPRPERPFFVEQLCKEIPYYRVRHYARPGLTGWAQINYPYGASIADAHRKLSYDFYYLKNQSILLDIYIMLSTVRVILFREGSR